MATANETQIKEAIDRSISHNEIVHVTIDGDSGDALNAIHTLVDFDTEDFDSVTIDRQVMDVWGFEENAPDGEMTWRLAIRFTE